MTVLRFRRLAGILLLAWVGLVIAVFILVMVPTESSLSNWLPPAFWDLRAMIYSLFYSPSVYD